MRFISACFLLVVCTSFYPAQDNTIRLAIARIQYIYKAKQVSGDSAWASFGSERYNIPLIYYAGDTTFIANPAGKFLRQFQPELVFSNEKLKIFRLASRIDNSPMHMRVSMSFGADTAAYDYNSPYIKCSSREEFEKVTGHTTSTTDWAAMVLHECFHGFQFLHTGYAQQAIEQNFIYSVIGDSLQWLYQTHEWFKKAVDTENNLLLKAIESTGENDTQNLVREFFRVREERRLRTKNETNHDIGLLEKSFETLEGTARFIEAYALGQPVSDMALPAIDSSFKTAAVASNAVHHPEYLYKTEVSDKYFYAMGYNETRLLKKMAKNYALLLFKQPALTLEDILKY